MSQKNGESPDFLEDGPRSPSLTSFSMRSKRPTIEPPKHRNPSSPTTKQASKRSRLDDEFTNPWRCESAPYDALPITHHKPIYNPACYFAENLSQLTRAERALKIMSYHYALSMQMSIFARSQPHHVLLGDPVQGCQLFNGALEKKKPTLAMGDIFPEVESTYVSRSGRHVKRRQPMQVYYTDDELETEKERNAKRAKVSDEAVNSSPEHKPPNAKRTTKKMSNTEIMARSSIFADSPAQSRSPRTTSMFGKLELIEQEKKKAELERIRFEKTLQQCSDDDDVDIQITSSNGSPKPAEDDDDEDFVPRRIIPPVPTKKGKSSASNKHSELPTTSTSSRESRDDPLSGRNLNGSASTSATNNKRGLKKKTLQMTKCPICGEHFAIKEIEEHASTCGLTSELEIESSIPNQRAEPPRF